VTDHEITGKLFGDVDRPVQSRRELRARRRRHRRRAPLRIIVLIGLVVAVGLAGWAAYAAIGPTAGSIFAGGESEEPDFPGPGQGQVQVVVEPGDTGESIATALRDAGVTRTRSAYLAAAKADPEAAATIQPGTYTLRKEMRGADAFLALTEAANRIADRTVLREGLWVSETFAALSKSTGVPVAEYEQASKAPEALGLPAEAGGNVEGWLYPASYEFADGTSATAQLRQLVAQTVRALEEAGIPRASWQRTLILASIIEGEVSSDTDRAKVARVILNRLADVNGPTVGLLQMDSTVHYLAKERGRAGTTAAQRASNSPYNTYKVKGLPPGPIGNPGKKSIIAASQPADGDWIYFVTVNPDTGETKFASTSAEHARNVKVFNAWCAANQDRC
jgi:UPF0755 protein